MPGQWPGDLRTGHDDDIHVQTPVSPIREEPLRSQRVLPYPLTRQESLQVPRSLGPGVESPRSRPTTPYPTSPSIPDELFFDWPLRSQPPNQVNDEASRSTSYLIFEPVVEEESNFENTDWRRYDPPQELLRSQDGTSKDLERLLAPSIERIQARHREEEGRRAAASRIERPLARAGRASFKPRRQVSSPTSAPNERLTRPQISITGALDTMHLTPPSRLTDSSETSLSSNDSGYGSLSPGTEPSRSPRSATRRSFGLSGFFKRKDRTIVGLEELDENLFPIPRSREVSPLPQSARTSLPPPPTRETPAPEPLTR
jgi:hypothetical protein